MATTPTPMPPQGGTPDSGPAQSPSMAPGGLEPLRQIQAVVQLVRNIAGAAPQVSAEAEQITNLAQAMSRKLVLSQAPQSQQAPPV